MATKKTKTKKAKPAPKNPSLFDGTPTTRRRRSRGLTTADRMVRHEAVGAPVRSVATAKDRTVPCRLCKLPIAFTQGLDEMAKHWEEEHPDSLLRLRRKIDSTSRWNHEPEA